MKHLLSFSVFEQKSTKLDTSPGASFNKKLHNSDLFDFSLPGSYSFKETIKDASEGKFYDKPWKEFSNNLPNFEKKFPCLPKKSIWYKEHFNEVRKKYLYYAIFLILKNSSKIKNEFKISSKDDFNKLLRLSLLVIDNESWFGLRGKQENEDVQMGILSGDSQFINTIKATAQNKVWGKEASVGYNQMKLSTWNGLEATHKIFDTKNIKSLGSHGKPNPAHFAVALVSSMEYIWNNYQNAKKIGGNGQTVITSDGKLCDYTLGSWAWDVAYNSYTFPWDKLTKKYCKCKFVDNIQKEGPFNDQDLPEEPEIGTSRGKTSVYWARDCKDSGSKPIWDQGNFKAIGSNDVKRLEVIPNSPIPNYLPRLYQNIGRKYTNRMYLKKGHDAVFKNYSCLGI